MSLKKLCFFSFFALTLFNTALSATASTTTVVVDVDESAKFHAVADNYYRLTMELNPEMATYFSYPGCDDRWSDLSPNAILRRDEKMLSLLDELHRIDRSILSESDQLSYDTLQWLLEDLKANQKFHREYLAINHLDAVHHDIAQVFNVMPKNTLADYENILKRMESVPLLIDQTIALLKKGLETQISYPFVILNNVPQQILQVMTADPKDCIYFLSFQTFPPMLSLEEREKLSAQAQALIKDKIYPALQQLYDFLVHVYIPGCRETVGWCALPNGLEWYQALVRSFTTTDLTPAEIHTIGLAEVDRIQKEMRDVLAQVNYQGDLQHFFAYLRTDPRFYYKERHHLIEGYRTILHKIEGQLPKLFGHIPKLPYIVAPVPEHSEDHATGAYYVLGSPKNNRPGVFYANTSNLESRPKYAMEALALHEALPGHHMQISLVLENEHLPNFRKISNFTAYIEGWGLYSEGLGKELGLYMDPYSYFGRLDHEVFRAARLVVDTGIHAFGWTRQQAIDYLLANTGMGLHEIETEVERYIVWPGQALAYKIGELKLLEIKKTAQECLGAHFDIRHFHDEVLKNGALPLSIFQAHMDEFIQDGQDRAR